MYISVSYTLDVLHENVYLYCAMNENVTLFIGNIMCIESMELEVVHIHRIFCGHFLDDQTNK